MNRNICISCGYKIFKSSHSDPYMCRVCEEIMSSEDRVYAYLDNA